MKTDLIFRVTMAVLWFLVAFKNLELNILWLNLILFTVAGLSLSYTIISIIKYLKFVREQ